MGSSEKVTYIPCHKNPVLLLPSECNRRQYNQMSMCPNKTFFADTGIWDQRETNHKLVCAA